MIRHVVIAACTGTLTVLVVLIFENLRSRSHRGPLRWRVMRGTAAQAMSRAWAAAVTTIADFGWLLAVNLAAVMLGAWFWVLVQGVSP